MSDGKALTTLTAGCAKAWSSIDLRSCKLMDTSAATNLAQMQSLTSVDLSDNKNLTDNAIQALASCEALSTLTLAGCGKVTEVLQVPSLTDVNMSGCSLTDDGIDGIRVCSALQVLILAGCNKLTSRGEFIPPLSLLLAA